jgi:hypothetical protein
MRVVNVAACAPNVASTLNQAAFNLGNAGGAFIGAAALGAGFAYEQLPLVGATLALGAVAVAAMPRSPSTAGRIRRAGGGMSGFVLDERSPPTRTGVTGLWLSELRLMNDARFPWLILVPRVPGAVEIHDLAAADRAALCDEITAVSEALPPSPAATS